MSVTTLDNSKCPISNLISSYCFPAAQLTAKKRITTKQKKRNLLAHLSVLLQRVPPCRVCRSAAPETAAWFDLCDCEGLQLGISAPPANLVPAKFLSFLSCFGFYNPSNPHKPPHHVCSSANHYNTLVAQHRYTPTYITCINLCVFFIYRAKMERLNKMMLQRQTVHGSKWLMGF